MTLADDEWECVSCTFIKTDSNSETETKYCELCGDAKPISIPFIMTSKDQPSIVNYTFNIQCIVLIAFAMLDVKKEPTAEGSRFQWKNGGRWR